MRPPYSQPTVETLQEEFGVVSNILSNMIDDDEVNAVPEYDYGLQRRPKVYLNETKLGPDGCSEERKGGCVGGVNNCVACRSFKFGTVCVNKVRRQDACLSELCK